MHDLHALVLAAGAGSRFGGRKMLAPWQDGLLIHAALRAAASAPVTGMTLVTGADAEDVSRAAWEWAGRAGEERLTIVHAVNHREGLAASLRAGIAALPPTCCGAFVFLGDMPRIPTSVLSDLPRSLQQDKLAAAP